MSNSSNGLYSVITTIQAPTAAVRSLSQRLATQFAPIIIVGDGKGPAAYDLPGVIFLDIAAQIDGPFELGRALPVGHYARKNVGYLEAVARGATCIYETDDDNAPSPSWAVREARVEAQRVAVSGWVNIYRCYSATRIWPRGFPLDELAASFEASPPLSGQSELVRAPIQQGLADNSPDVDAIWRLVLDAPLHFNTGPSTVLSRGAWCPFNSQSTWWWREAFPLLYLPSFCSFRMTDIWRSFIAQRCLWEMGVGVVFHAAEVIQDRNPHNLMRDFTDEIPGYQRNKELVAALEALSLRPGGRHVGENLRRCYAALVGLSFFSEAELDLVDAWLRDLDAVMR